MKTRWLIILVAIFALCAPINAQRTASNPLGGNLAVQDAGTCSTTGSFLWQQLPSNAATTIVNLAGTFSGTLTIRLSNNGGGTWTTNTTTTSAGNTSISTNGFTDICADVTAFTSGSFAVTITTGLNTGPQGPAGPAGSGGVSSPSSLPTFFNRFMGLSPTDAVYGAKGDTHIFFDCGMTSNNHLTCGSAHFVSTDCQTGSGCTGTQNKWFESCAANCQAFPGTAPTINAGTITAFNSSTDVTVSVTAGTTYTNTRTAYGTDDDAAMQSWVTALVAAPTNGVVSLARSGYLPQGGYAIKQPLKIVGSCSLSNGTCNTGESGPNAGAVGNLRPSLWIAGQGTASSFIYVRTAGQFTWPTQTTDTGALLVQYFDFSVLTNFAIIADASAHNTSTVTSPGTVALINIENSTHSVWSNLWVQGFHNTTNNACGFASFAGDFESSYTALAIESSDINGCIAYSFQGANQIMEKVSFIGTFFENPLQGQNIQIGDPFTLHSLSIKQFNMENCHSLKGNVASINFLSNVSTASGETIQLSKFRQQAVNSGGLGLVVNTTTNLNVDCHGCYLEDTSAVAGNLLVDNTSANATFNFYGGNFSGSGLTNLFSNAGNIFVYGTKIQAGPTVANIQTGAGNTYSFIPVAGANGGWTGKGTIQGTMVASNQGTVFATSNVGLTSGWGTSTVTAASGFSQHYRFTISVTGTISANPTITITLPNPLPTSATLCSLGDNGGNNPFIGTIVQTTQSATAPIFTITGTPTAGDTLQLEGICGP